MDKDRIIHLLVNEETDSLFQKADDVRRKHCGDEIHLRGIIEYSNHCRCLCAYCGLFADNHDLPRYRMNQEQILETALKAFNQGVRTIVLQGGEDTHFNADLLCEIIQDVKSIGDVAVTLSSGEFPRDDYQKMRDAGADRYLLKIETTNPEIYKRLHPGLSQENRIRCLHDLKELGFQTGSGALIGLPGQTIEDIADDILFCANLNLDMVTFSPFIPHPGTPLAKESGGDWLFSHKVLAVSRLAMPDAHIPCSTALASITPDDYKTSLKSGANVVMADLTPPEFVEYYDIYPGKAPTGDKKERDAVQRLKNIIAELGRPLAVNRGDSLIQ
ncbi:[FeFe] hydrogenase H-cluster radical SAM maturase HydE [bacterium]|nr:[FeFe] hydrogenase H-cluster radical SAM maturase HydE [bacterium]